MVLQGGHVSQQLQEAVGCDGALAPQLCGPESEMGNVTRQGNTTSKNSNSERERVGTSVKAGVVMKRSSAGCLLVTKYVEDTFLP